MIPRSKRAVAIKGVVIQNQTTGGIHVLEACHPKELRRAAVRKGEGGGPTAVEAAGFDNVSKLVAEAET
jgi:hypothetical protein